MSKGYTSSLLTSVFSCIFSFLYFNLGLSVPKIHVPYVFMIIGTSVPKRMETFMFKWVRPSVPRKVGLSVPKGMGPSVHYINIFSFDFKLISCSTLVIEKPFIPKTLVLNKGSLSCNSAVSYSFYRGHSKMHFTHLYTKAFVHSIVYIFYYFFICQLQFVFNI